MFWKKKEKEWNEIVPWSNVKIPIEARTEEETHFSSGGYSCTSVSVYDVPHSYKLSERGDFYRIDFSYNPGEDPKTRKVSTNGGLDFIIGAGSHRILSIILLKPGEINKEVIDERKREVVLQVWFDKLLEKIKEAENFLKHPAGISREGNNRLIRLAIRNNAEELFGIKSMNSDQKRFAEPIKRAMVKISGEAFCGKGEFDFGVNTTEIKKIATEIKTAYDAGTQMVLVVGGGNFLRGKEIADDLIPQSSADYMGMLATVMNAVAVQEVLESMGCATRIQSSLRVDAIAEPFSRRKALHHLDKNHILILAGGTGKPFVTTDTAAAQAAIELDCNALFKATKVDGLYTEDPIKEPNAKKIEKITYQEVVEQYKNFKVMDMAAISLCMEHNLPIIVFDLFKPENIKSAVQGYEIGTLIN